MTRDEIVTALRCYGGDNCEGCPYDEIFAVDDAKCIGKAMDAATGSRSGQQRHIEALMKSNAALRDTVLRRDVQIEKLAADRKDLINELCQYCGKYKQAHEGACDGCRWREM